MRVQETIHYPFEDALGRQLGKVPAVEAVYFAVDEDRNTIHVYSIVREVGSRFYPKLSMRQRLVEQKFPKMTFEFHIRAHQGRSIDLVAPFGAQLVFRR